jgi:hypothetical protein
MADLSSANSLKTLVQWIIGFFDPLIILLTSIALVLFLYSGVRYVYKAAASKDKRAERDALLWGGIALFVLVSVWGILRIACSTLLGSDSCGNGIYGPPQPTEQIGNPINILPPGVH